MGELNNGSYNTDSCLARGGGPVLVGTEIMDPVILIAAAIIIMVEISIRLL